MLHKRNVLLLITFCALCLIVGVLQRSENKKEKESFAVAKNLEKTKTLFRGPAVQASPLPSSVPSSGPAISVGQLGSQGKGNDSPPRRRSRFEDQPVLSMKESKPDLNGIYLRTLIVGTKGKDKLIRVVVRFSKDVSTGEERIVSEVAMNAEQVVVKLWPSYGVKDLEALVRNLGYQKPQPVPYTDLFLVGFNGKDPDALPKVREALGGSKMVDLASPDYLYFPN